MVQIPSQDPAPRTLREGTWKLGMHQKPERKEKLYVISPDSVDKTTHLAKHQAKDKSAGRLILRKNECFDCSPKRRENVWEQNQGDEGSNAQHADAALDVPCILCFIFAVR